MAFKKFNDGASDDTVTVKVRDSSASADTEIASTMTVPADSRLDVVGDSTKVFLENGDSISLWRSYSISEYFRDYIKGKYAIWICGEFS